MEKLFVSSWYDNVETVPENYVFPPGIRPGDDLCPKSDVIVPIIDLANLHDKSGRASVVKQIMDASKEFGVLQVINHGVSRETLDETRRMFKDFFKLPAEDRAKEIIKEYSVRMIELGSSILEVISEGLGLEPGYFGKDLTEDAKVNVNHYPPCPDPTLTLGTSKHNDRSLLTILLQGHGNVPGLQYCNDGQLTTIDPSPDALVVFMGHIMKIVSNGTLRTAEHRSVTNKTEDRESSAFFLCPTQDCVIEPAKALLTPENPPLFKSITYKEFIKSHNANRIKKENPDDVVKTFFIKA
ncbi:hypothetical protein KSS87_018596 [Heliosperma pusillum]|nr:hypothetical protein KSS87_018596 [Heliosperma pusillum]